MITREKNPEVLDFLGEYLKSNRNRLILNERYWSPKVMRNFSANDKYDEAGWIHKRGSPYDLKIREMNKEMLEKLIGENFFRDVFFNIGKHQLEDNFQLNFDNSICLFQDESEKAMLHAPHDIGKILKNDLVKTSEESIRHYQSMKNYFEKHFLI